MTTNIERWYPGRTDYAKEQLRNKYESCGIDKVTGWFEGPLFTKKLSPNIRTRPAQYAPVGYACVIHYTAGGNADGSVSWLCNPDAGVSAHFVVAHDGNIYQLGSVHDKALHAGRSSLKGVEDVNKFSVGIETANWGMLDSNNAPLYPPGRQPLPSAIVFKAPHKNDAGHIVKGWELYTVAQMHSLACIAATLESVYGIKTFVGHDDIAPQRKTDPGPAFDWEAFHAMKSLLLIKEELTIVENAVPLTVREQLEEVKQSITAIQNRLGGTK